MEKKARVYLYSWPSEVLLISVHINRYFTFLWICFRFHITYFILFPTISLSDIPFTRCVAAGTVLRNSEPVNRFPIAPNWVTERKRYKERAELADSGLGRKKWLGSLRSSNLFRPRRESVHWQAKEFKTGDCRNKGCVLGVYRDFAIFILHGLFLSKLWCNVVISISLYEGGQLFSFLRTYAGAASEYSRLYWPGLRWEAAVLAG